MRQLAHDRGIARRAEGELVMLWPRNVSMDSGLEATGQLAGKRAKKNLLASLGLSAVDYKDTATLRVFISERGKIRSRQPSPV